MDMNVFIPINQNGVKASAMIEEMDRLWERQRIEGQTLNMKLGEFEIDLTLDENTFSQIYNALLGIRNNG